MAELPVVSGKAAVRAFIRLGWKVHRRESSHISLTKQGSPKLLTVPDHKEVHKERFVLQFDLRGYRLVNSLKHLERNDYLFQTTKTTSINQQDDRCIIPPCPRPITAKSNPS